MSRSFDAFALVRDAVNAGLVVQAEHPDFGGVLTCGWSKRAVGDRVLEAIQHGGSVDVGGEAFWNVSDLARFFVNQVGKNRAYEGAKRAFLRAAEG